MTSAPPVARRDLLRALAGGAAGLPVLAVLGCKPAPAIKPAQALVPLAGLPPGTHLAVTVDGKPVDVTRTADGVVARSLLCSHWGCVVAWKKDQHAYVCPCHDGRYDAEGNVMAGPPPKGLARVPVALFPTHAVIGS